MSRTVLSSSNYTFDASAQEITFSGITVELEQISRIVNVKDNVLIYDSERKRTPGINRLGGTISGAVLTLQYDTTAMSDTDELQVILFESATSGATTDTSYQDGATFTEGTDKVVATGSIVEPSTTLTAGEVGATAMTVDRKLKTAAFDDVNTADSVQEINPKETKNVWNKEMDAVTTTTTVYVDVENYDMLNFQFELASGTTDNLTIEATLQNDGTAAASCVYQDITSDLVGSATITSDEIFLDSAGVFKGIKYVKFIFTYAAGTATLLTYKGVK